MNMIDFSTTKEDGEKVSIIASRAVEAYPSMLLMMEVMMDLTATHLNGCRLDLDAMIEASEPNLMHDIYGIAVHLDRDTGRLQGEFLPMFAEKGADK